MKEVQVKTQAELDEALKKGHHPVCVGYGVFIVFANSTVYARENSTVYARENSTVHARANSTVYASGNSTVHARGNSTVRAYANSTVYASGNSTVYARENSTVRAYANSKVYACDNSKVDAFNNSKVDVKNKYTFARVHDKTAKATGCGIIARVQLPKTAKQWCEFYGIPILGRGKKQYAVLFKGLNEQFETTGHERFPYRPGSTPTAPDWDGGERECGGGLHFSPSPHQTLRFAPDAKKFVACPVLLSDMRKPAAYDIYTEKIKARGCCAPIWEVDIDGNKVDFTS